MNSVLKIVFILIVIGMYENPIVECAPGEWKDECKADKSCNEGTGLICAADNKCRCEDGYDWGSGALKCIKQATFGEECGEEGDFICIGTGLICDTDHISKKEICQCKESHEWFVESSKCVNCTEILGGSCGKEKDHEKCCRKAKDDQDLVCENKKCVCKAGTEAKDGKCVAVPIPETSTKSFASKSQTIDWCVSIMFGIALLIRA